MSSYFHIFIIITWFFCRLFIWNTCYFISNFVTNQITSCFCCFLNCSFWSSFYCIYCRFFLTLSRSFWPYFLLKFLPMFLAKDKNPYPFTYIRSRRSTEYLIFIHYLHLITIIKFILSSISNGYCFDQWTILQFCYIHSWMFLGIYDL